jgi:hypothetical protein
MMTRIFILVFVFTGSVLTGQYQSHFLKFKVNPLAIPAQNMYQIGAEYGWKNRHSINITTDYAVEKYRWTSTWVCWSCAMNDFAQSRYRVTVSYRYYFDFVFPGYEDLPRMRLVYLEPYLSYRNWKGIVSAPDYSLGYLNSKDAEVSVDGMSAGLGLGLHFGKHGWVSFDWGTYLGWYFFNEGLPPKFDGNQSRYQSLQMDVRFSLFIGIGPPLE